LEPKHKHHLDHLHDPNAFEELCELRTVDAERKVADKDLKVGGEALAGAEGVLLLAVVRDGDTGKEA